MRALVSTDGALKSVGTMIRECLPHPRLMRCRMSLVQEPISTATHPAWQRPRIVVCTMKSVHLAHVARPRR